MSLALTWSDPIHAFYRLPPTVLGAAEEGLPSLLQYAFVSFKGGLSRSIANFIRERSRAVSVRSRERPLRANKVYP